MEIIYVLLKASLGIALVIALTRANGLRSFSKMSGFDFAITVAKGSVLAGIVMSDSSGAFWANMAAMLGLFVVQGVISRVRRASEPFEDQIDNDPLMLMENGELIPANLRKGQISEADVMAKLREANALDFSKVHAVVLEATGDVSVLHGKTVPDDRLLAGIVR